MTGILPAWKRYLDRVYQDREGIFEIPPTEVFDSKQELDALMDRIR